MDCRTQLASLAIEELDKGDFLMATKILTTGIRLEPNNHELYFERSICHHKLGDFQASLDDANAAIRLNSSDYNIYYQKGLALIGLSLFSEAVTSFKKAIELRAKQDDSKLSDIFKLLRDATNELNTARRKPGATTNQVRGETTSLTAPTAATTIASSQTIASANRPNINNEPAVDSTTDKPISREEGQVVDERNQHHHHPQQTMDTVIKNGSDNNNTNLVVTSNRNNQTTCTNHHHQIISNPNIAISSRVSSSASQPVMTTPDNNHPRLSSHTTNNSSNNNLIPHSNHAIRETKTPDHHHNHHHLHHHHNNMSNMSNDQQHINPTSKSSTSSSYDWSIRRSERIFLHNTNEPGTSGPREGAVVGAGGNSEDYTMNQKHRSGSNPSSICSGRNAKCLQQLEHNKNNTMDNNNYPPARATKSKTGTSSVVDSDIDVDDSNYDNSQYNFDLDPSNKRVMVAPSSSMPATSNALTAGGSRDKDSYSSKYKRLRRDRERARRGTSKLCTIKLSDLEELHKSMKSDGSAAKCSTRVIAPIDGWLYSGQLSVDRSLDNNGQTQYVVKLDGDSSGSSYLFTQSTVLNDVIKEVRVKTVSELRKGARICCYWSRTYKCLSTGVVTSRTFEATKSLVSVKYDNGDLSALPLEDLRLLPPDYPKYMSNCDPLLLAKNGDNSMASASNGGTSRIVVNGKASSDSRSSEASYSKAIVDEIIRKCDETDLGNSTENCAATKSPIANNIQAFDHHNNNNNHHHHNQASDDQQHHQVKDQDKSTDVAADESMPPTNETIDFITGDDLIENNDRGDEQGDLDDNHDDRTEVMENNHHENVVLATNDNSGPQLMASRASSEENNYSVEYQPWRFEGAPKRTKRNGRTYRDNYLAIRRGNEVLKVGDSAELMPRDESILPFVAKIDGIWANTRGEMRVRVRWYYRLVETEGEPYELEDGENALFETDHFDENDVQSIWRTTKILSWTEYTKNHMKHVNKPSDGPKIFYLAGYYDPVRRIKHLRTDVKGSQ